MKRLTSISAYQEYNINSARFQHCEAASCLLNAQSTIDSMMHPSGFMSLSAAVFTFSCLSNFSWPEKIRYTVLSLWFWIIVAVLHQEISPRYSNTVTLPDYAGLHVYVHKILKDF